MQLLKYPFWLFYRIWFYVLALVPIILFFPFILITISSEKTYPYFFKIARIWAKFVLMGMGFSLVLKGKLELEKNKSYVFVANHTSMTDIMLMLVVVKEHPFVFVGKKELEKIPLFGYIYKRVCILVDRKNNQSRKAVFDSAQKRINQGLSICIFPEGGVPEESVTLDEFKDGAFRIAIEHQISMVPMTFLDNKKRFPFTFFSGSPGKMRVKIHNEITTKTMNLTHKNNLKQQVRRIILEDL